MDILDTLQGWFTEFDVVFKIAAFLAAPGGIWFWIDKYSNRVQITIRNLGFAPVDTNMSGIMFEAENVGTKLTSFEPQFTISGYSAQANNKTKKETITFKFEGDDRQLKQHVSKTFIGWHNHQEKLIMMGMWFMVFRFPLTRGRTCRIRAINVDGFHQVGFFRFHRLRLMYVLFGKLP